MTYRLRKSFLLVAAGDTKVSLRRLTKITRAEYEIETRWMRPAMVAKMRAEGRLAKAEV
jgi:hypothetical protein